jgi:hypothetical protein
MHYMQSLKILSKLLNFISKNQLYTVFENTWKSKLAHLLIFVLNLKWVNLLI